MAGEQGTHNTEISDSEAKLDQIGNVLADAIRRFDSLDKRFDAVEGRMDSIESTRKDANEVVEPGKPAEPTADARKDGEREEDCNLNDKARKDAEEEEERRADAARRRDSEEERRRADAEERASASERAMDSMASELAEMKAKLARLEPRSRSDSDAQRFATIQEQADVAFQAFSDKAPAPMAGETPMDYKRRLAGRMQKHSTRWAEKPLNAVSDEALLDVIVGDIYNDSLSAARMGAAVAPGELRELTHRSAAGHTVTTFEGDASSWMDTFAGHTMRATGKFNTPV